MIPRKLKNFNLFVDGRGYAGRIEELALPKLTVKTEEFRAGGMDAAVELDMGMEKLEGEFTLAEYAEDVIRQFGLTNGAAVALKFKGSIEADDAGGAKVPVEVVLRGRWRELDMGNWKAGDNSTLKVAVMANYYSYASNGQTLIEIDVPGMKRVIGGTDLLAQTRRNIGM